MGKVRARTDDELAARKNEILNSAKEQLMTMEYDDITLATIAEKTSVSRPTMYRYYEKKELVFVDLLIREYEDLEQEIQPLLKRKVGREQFCRKMTSVLWNRQVLLKLLSLQLPIWKKEYSDEMLRDFVNKTAVYQHTLDLILQKQFPEASPASRNLFRIQFSTYCNSLYVLDHLPESMMQAMIDEQVFETVPSGEETCFHGLLLLSAVMQESD